MVELDDGLVAFRLQSRGPEAVARPFSEKKPAVTAARHVPWTGAREPLADQPGIE